MGELIVQDYDVIREVVSRTQAVDTFRQRDEDYKVEIASEIPDDEIIALYHHQEYTDMCRGPHVPKHAPPARVQADPPGRLVLARRCQQTRCCSASTARPGPTRSSSSTT